MNRKQSLFPIGKVFGGLDGTVQAIRGASPQVTCRLSSDHRSLENSASRHG